MELIRYAIGTAVWWALSLTVLLPFFLLLKFNKYVRDRWFSWFFINCFGLIMGPPELKSMRVLSFEILKEHLSCRTKKDQLEVLEIGIGDGMNLAHFPEHTNLTALDMNESFEKYLVQNLKNYPEVNHKRTVIARAENMPEIQDSSMDVVVCTYVLCSVENVAAVLAESKRILKPGGVFLFTEHVSFPKSDWGLLIQKIASPLWYVYCDGCMLHNETVNEINHAGFSDVVMEKSFRKARLLFIRPLIGGIAIK